MARRYAYPTSFYIDADSRTQLKEMADSMAISTSSMVRVMIRREFEKYQATKRRVAREEAELLVQA